LKDIYQLGDRFCWEAHLIPGSSVVGKSLADSRNRGISGVSPSRRSGAKKRILSYPSQARKIYQQDVLLLVGVKKGLRSLRKLGLEIEPGNGGSHLSSRGVTFCGSDPGTYSGVVGQTLKDVGFRAAVRTDGL